MFFNRRLSGYKNALSMSEILIAIAIIGVIAGITMSALKNAIPSKEETMHKKMSYLVEQVVTQLYNDEVIYPRKSDLFTQGFQNTERVNLNGIDYSGDEKFCRLFASKFNKLSKDVVCENEVNDTASTNALGKKSFTSTDNVDWYLPVTNFNKGIGQIMIDVNASKEPNCLAGTENCKNPDRFIYYIKPNGTITYTKPANVINSKFNILLNVKTEGCGTTPECAAVGGTYSIAQLNSNGTEGTYHTGAQYFRNLDRNTRYVIQATPNTGYFTDWQLNKKRVTIVSSDVPVYLNFHKRSKYCITLDINNCTESDISNCGTYSLQTNCGYRAVTNKTGLYKLTSAGIYEYVGLGVDGGEYNYECPKVEGATSQTLTLSSGLSKGHPKFDPTTGELLRDSSNNVQADEGYNAVFSCDLLTGDYRIKVEPKNAYNPSPTGDDYIQDVRLGTDNLTFSVDLYK